MEEIGPNYEPRMECTGFAKLAHDNSVITQWKRTWNIVVKRTENSVLGRDTTLLKMNEIWKYA